MKAELETAIYSVRFSDRELQQARAFWKPICQYLQRYVDKNGVTLDLGAGYCHFINNIQSKGKIAVDLNEENLVRYADKDVRCVTCSGADLGEIESGTVDAVFSSNVYEHFPSREDVASSFREVKRILRPGGRFIILQPNFAHCVKTYFDFFDHRLTFTHKGMIEGLEISGFSVETAISQFLPYTSKSKIPRAPWMVSLYLAFPPAWRVLGGQMLLVAYPR